MRQNSTTDKQIIHKQFIKDHEQIIKNKYAKDKYVIRGAVWMALMIFISSALVLTGCEKPKKQEAASAPHIPSVSTVTVKEQQVTLTSELPGRTSAYRIAEIRPQVSGIIQKRLFKEGSDVKEGAVLYQIDAAPFKAALDNAKANHLVLQKAAEQSRSALKASIADIARLKANLELAKANKKRYEQSFRDKIVSAIQLDQIITEVKVASAALQAAEAEVDRSRDAVAAADASIKQAEAAMETANINLGYCRVTAPISGRIGKSNVTEGAIVTAYQAMSLATIQQLDPIYADVPQSTTELLRLRKVGMNYGADGLSKVRLILEDKSQYPLEGTLQFSDVTVDPTTGSVILRVVFPNPDGILLPGMFVQTVIKEGVNDHAILVPQQGVSRDQRGNPYALVVDNESKAAMRILTIDRAIADQWLVTSGLTPGDRVIVEGALMLRPGTVVNASPAQLNGGGQGAGNQSGAAAAKQEKGGK